ncbi:enoyl-CoA hydratase/isomerase family protein [Rhodococcus sp. P1Y]|uniref:enoyl-CoA hydratase/isomerase family protein n=1 Tax=Rhodococcus sp. P1Y TaxID=1302308 RepID=UPI000EAFA677|nr:enoyl-CoA hydratase/isomerase family protein [Rhodococcus sp. P1Y]AYJ50322.1 enoyl-CoA hydratase/isomerase family protein [Rhodococcus sp. P1Y]
MTYPPPALVHLDREDLAAPGSDRRPGPTIGVSASGTAETEAADRWADESLFTLTEQLTDDPRFVHVPSVASASKLCTKRVSARPLTTRVLQDVLRSYSAHLDVRSGLVSESLAYSMLQAGPEFAQWLGRQGARRKHTAERGVVLGRAGSSLSITFDSPERHNAFSDLLRAGLLEGLAVAVADTSIERVCLGGNGPSFCSGGDLREFGLSADPVSSHLSRLAYSPAASLAALASRLGRGLTAQVHGAVLGSGLEMAAFCPFVVADRESMFGLPELDLGLIPGAGGTVSVTRRIGRWRTAYLVISGARVDAPTALQWGLVDDID